MAILLTLRTLVVTTVCTIILWTEISALAYGVLTALTTNLIVAPGRSTRMARPLRFRLRRHGVRAIEPPYAGPPGVPVESASSMISPSLLTVASMTVPSGAKAVTLLKRPLLPSNGNGDISGSGLGSDCAPGNILTYSGLAPSRLMLSRYRTPQAGRGGMDGLFFLLSRLFIIVHFQSIS